jgi:uncharacterized protein
MTQYHLRRPEKSITDPVELQEILFTGKYAVVAMSHQDTPYLVTMNYGYDPVRNVLYFHCAASGRKMDCLAQNSNVCATIIADYGYIEGECDHAFKSLVLFGTMRRILDLEEKKYALDILLQHLEPNPEIIRTRSLKDTASYSNVGILRLDIVQMTGKQNGL